MLRYACVAFPMLPLLTAITLKTFLPWPYRPITIDATILGGHHQNSNVQHVVEIFGRRNGVEVVLAVYHWNNTYLTHFTVL